MSRDLTKGNPYKIILMFALPIFLGNVFQSVYSVTDTFIVGHMISSDAMSGVGSTGSISFLILGMANGLTAGFAVRTSQFFGAKNPEKIRKSIAISYELCVVIAAILTSIALPLSSKLLKIMNTPENYFDYAFCYLQTIFIGMILSILYNMTAGTLRAVGDSRAPLFFLIASAIMNVGFDIAFIAVFKMKYYGVGLATVLSQFISCIASTLYLYIKYPELRPTKSDFAFDKGMITGHISTGLPMALQYSITAAGTIFQQSAVNSLNTGYPGIVTAFTAAGKIDGFVSQPFQALGTSMATYAGQNYGAGRQDRISKGVRIAMLYSGIAWAISFGICAFFGGSLSSIFLDRSTGDAAIYYDSMISYASRYLFTQSSLYLILAAVLVYRNTLQGMGYSAITMIAGVLELIARASMALILVKLFEFNGIIFSNAFAWLLAAVFLVPVFYYCSSRRKKQNKAFNLK